MAELLHGRSLKILKITRVHSRKLDGVEGGLDGRATASTLTLHTTARAHSRKLNGVDGGLDSRAAEACLLQLLQLGQDEALQLLGVGGVHAFQAQAARMRMQATGSVQTGATTWHTINLSALPAQAVRVGVLGGAHMLSDMRRLSDSGTHMLSGTHRHMLRVGPVSSMAVSIASFT